ncbi:MAG: N-acetylmuramoyl-L-alanine amidase [Actinomycetota bacterium]|nr:N-acetylmuramoyl-L-alanine amidase [Actinomycetota bacterium]
MTYFLAGGVSALFSGALLALPGCGAEPTPKPAQGTTISAERIEAQNLAAHKRIEERTRRVARAIARREAARKQAARTTVPARAVPSVQMPAITRRFIPYGRQRREEMASYAQRHYGIATSRLQDPKVIVEHYTATANAQSAINTFSADVADPELHELPGTCAHFVIDTDGTIYQLVSLRTMCRHTVGLNYTAFGIEHAGFSAQQVLADAPQIRASLALTQWLRCRYGISIRNVIGHNESLSSPFHHELVARLRTQTHADWTRPEMEIYRAKLRRLTC